MLIIRTETDMDDGKAPLVKYISISIRNYYGIVLLSQQPPGSQPNVFKSGWNKFPFSTFIAPFNIFLWYPNDIILIECDSTGIRPPLHSYSECIHFKWRKTSLFHCVKIFYSNCVVTMRSTPVTKRNITKKKEDNGNGRTKVMPTES